MIDFPSPDDWQRIYNSTPFDKLSEQIIATVNTSNSKSGIGLSSFKRNLDTKEFLLQLQHRFADIAKSYIFLTYYFEKGIPDEEWHISPGRKGSSIEYFPHFESIHFIRKDWFDYYADTFYHKLFSAWDMVGHILNVQYKLGIKQEKVTFHRAIDKLSDKDKTVYDSFDETRKHPAFQRASRLRNDVTHNQSPSSTGISITLNEEGGSMGIREYTTSATIMNNAREVIDLLEKTISLITA